MTSLEKATSRQGTDWSGSLVKDVVPRSRPFGVTLACTTECDCNPLVSKVEGPAYLRSCCLQAVLAVVHCSRKGCWGSRGDDGRRGGRAYAMDEVDGTSDPGDPFRVQTADVRTLPFHSQQHPAQARILGINGLQRGISRLPLS